MSDLNNSSAPYDVCVVGLGPVGATLSALLGLAGRSVLAIERNPVIYPQPRAAHIDGETMRTFQSLGIADEILPHIRPAPQYEFISAAGEVLMSVPPGEMGPDGWYSHYMIYQPGIEYALRDLLERMPNVTTIIGAAADGVREEDHRVVVCTDAGTTAEARYLVGCDGGSSRVRSLAGIELDDDGFDEPWLVIDVVTGDDPSLPQRCIQFCDPARPVTFTQLGPGRNRWEFMILPGEDPVRFQSDEVIDGLLTPWGGLGRFTVERRAIYRFHALLARDWRKGRIFLAGDAAHQMPPFAGQGLCSGIRDAANLHWKIAAALDGAPEEPLLDTYESERKPHARGIVDMAVGAGRIVCTTDPAIADARDARARAEREAGAEPAGLVLPPIGKSPLIGDAGCAGTMFPQPVASGHRQLDDVLGAGPWLIENTHAPAQRLGDKHFALGDPALAEFRRMLAIWFAAQGNPAAVLVRPDRIVFDAGEPSVLWATWRQLTVAPVGTAP